GTGWSADGADCAPRMYGLSRQSRATKRLSENMLSRGDKKCCRNLHSLIALYKRIYAFLADAPRTGKASLKTGIYPNLPFKHGIYRTRTLSLASTVGPGVQLTVVNRRLHSRLGQRLQKLVLWRQISAPSTVR